MKTISLAVTFATVLVACSQPPLVRTSCRSDDACSPGLLCEDFECVPASSKRCENVVDGAPILQPDPSAIDFGSLDVQTKTYPLALRNIGTCALTLFEAQLANGDAGFSCPFCGESFPIEIFPGRAKEVSVDFNQRAVGLTRDTLTLLSDDKTFPELQVPVRANYLGAPKLTAAPSAVDFGYVAVGRQATRGLTLSNQGTGVATVTISAATVVPAGDDFTLVTPVTEPVVLGPASAQGSRVLALELRYTPRMSMQHTGELVLTTSHGELRVPLTGSAATPPKMDINPAMVDVGNVPLGRTGLASITITNSGGAPLTVAHAWAGTMRSTDLFVVQAAGLAPIAPGAYAELQVGFTATSLGPVSGLLVLTSNDPAKPSVTVAVSANGVPGTSAQVVKIEMTFDNGSNTAFDDDVRNVDMTLEHPFGYVCNKQYPAPMMWGAYGNPTWLAFAPKEEPERIVLADATADGTYRVQLTYLESCKSVPADLVAGVLGITVDALLSYFSGGTVPVNSGDVSDIIGRLCLSRDSTAATVRVAVNGSVVKEKTVTLSRKGDSVYALDLVRSNGSFSVP